MSIQELAPARQYVPMPESMWTDDKVAEMRRLIADGVRGKDLLSALECNRSQLYSKLNRLDIKLGMSTPRPRAAPKKKIARIAMSYNKQSFGEPSAPGIMDLTPEPSDAAMSLADLDNTRCHWPISGAGLDMMFCGERADECGPYCSRHRAIAYRGRR